MQCLGFRIEHALIQVAFIANESVFLPWYYGCDQLVALNVGGTSRNLHFGMGDLRGLSLVSDLINELESTNMQSTMTTSTSRRRYGHSRPSSDFPLAGFSLRSCSGCKNASFSSLYACIFWTSRSLSSMRAYRLQLEMDSRQEQKGVVSI